MITEHTYRVKRVKRIVDGDTVDLVLDLGFGIEICERFRLHGINAPESRGESKVEGKKSTEWLREEIMPHSDDGSLLVQSTKQGSFRRWLGTLYLVQGDGTMCNVNEKMVTEGFAVPYRK